MTTLPISDPDFVPHRDVERVWAGHDRHYATGTLVPYDRTRALAQMGFDGMPHSDSVLARAITAYGPNGRVIRGLIPHWPIGKFEERPWVVAQRQAAENEHTVQRIHADRSEWENEMHDFLDGLIERLEATGNAAGGELLADQQRFLKLLRLARDVGTNLSAVAALFVGAFVQLDIVSDGKLNAVITWCHVLQSGPRVHV